MKDSRITIKHLRRHAIAASLFPPTTLKKAIEQLGFVQADPIRAPARAQDLILRHRVKDYRVGDLESKYPKLGIEEDFFYAYGFMPQSTWRLLHPRMEGQLGAEEKRVLQLVSGRKHLHPRELEEHLGRAREVNAWGGYSKRTTRILHSLHYRGLLRVAGREKGIRVYQVVRNKSAEAGIMAPQERLRQLILLMARILAPVPERSLRATLQHLAHAAPALEGRQSVLTGLIKSGELASSEVQEMRYLWPAGPLAQKAPGCSVRILAPFDPLIWDRRRFEHFWGWTYRFEAYTPIAKRRLGYYAMPLLWGDDVIGWANISLGKGGDVTVVTGFVRKKPDSAAFEKELEAEIERIRGFLRAARKSDPKS